ncbi:MAG: AAA family ATPase [Candidatus Bathyarchaeota archaeon]|nr:ATPase domain-containing protein [Candidatus Bathyarchaeum tardum]WGM89625.1 MAG: ATPase domain-containing protein [Candidatus Bathyarchaeum tardum]WNZ30273.1 MAG: AAA family ATPase [Candidatus Bathyarchaeota archaeon]
MQNYVKTGCVSLDKLLGGGFLTESISLIYGEAETGKTSLVVQCAVTLARRGIKSLFIDTDGTFSYERLSQIAEYDYEKISPFLIIMRPTTFQDQSQALDHLEKIITNKFGLIVVDTVTSLYRAELDDIEKTYALNRELNRQIAVLKQIAKTRNVAVLIISQVRSVPIGESVKTKPVATRVLNYWSDIVLDMRQSGQTRVIKVLREKHPTIKGTGYVHVKIESSGITDYRH